MERVEESFWGIGASGATFSASSSEYWQTRDPSSATRKNGSHRPPSDSKQSPWRCQVVPWSVLRQMASRLWRASVAVGGVTVTDPDHSRVPAGNAPSWVGISHSWMQHVPPPAWGSAEVSTVERGAKVAPPSVDRRTFPCPPSS